MNDIEIRMECLRLASATDGSANGVLEVAQRFYEFVSGIVAKPPALKEVPRSIGF